MIAHNEELTSEVTIVGAGPTGLSLACALTQRGITSFVVDMQAAGANTSRAAVVHSRTLEVLESIGVSSRLQSLGIQAERFTIRDRDKILLPVHFGDLPTAYPFTLMISQAVTESVLLDRLHELGGYIMRPKVAVAVEQDEEGVTTTLDTGEKLRSKYLVGADGMHSSVREKVNIPFPGNAYDESFVLADVKLSGNIPSDEVILYFSPAGLVVVAPLPNGHHRIVATVDTAPQHPDIGFVQNLLNERGPERQDAVVKEVIWGSRFKVHHRIAESYRSGRVFLAGDAAHVHSPAGGQGMNTGIQDAIVLANALAQSIQIGNSSLLDDYSTNRRPVAEKVVSLADRLTTLATVSGPCRPVRNKLLQFLSLIPGFEKRLALQLSGLIYRDQVSQESFAKAV